MSSNECIRELRFEICKASLRKCVLLETLVRELQKSVAHNEEEQVLCHQYLPRHVQPGILN